MKVNIKRINLMESANLSGVKVTSTKANIRMINSMEMENLLGKMEINTKVNLKTENLGENAENERLNYLISHLSPPLPPEGGGKGSK